MTALAPWFLLVGLLLVVMAIVGRWVARLPVSGAILYLGIGWAIGPTGAGLLDPWPDGASRQAVEALAEVAVLVSVFCVGLKLRSPVGWSAWRVPVRLATVSMVVSVAVVAPAAVWLCGLPPAGALLAAALLAPTDPVLASDVQVRHPDERDPVRFALTVEGGINDGSAYPLVMLGLGWLGLHPLGPAGLRWVAVDLAWACVAGLAIGWLWGRALGRCLLRMGGEDDPEYPVEFLVLGTIALVYGIALLCRTYGFLAVFGASLALRQQEWLVRPGRGEPDRARSRRIAERLLGFTGRIERIAEVAVVLVVGALFARASWSPGTLALAGIALLVARPLAVRAGLAGVPVAPLQRRLLAWFGIRGIGSVYYLAFVLGAGVAGPLADMLVSVVVQTVALSILLHGLSATPLMEAYRRARQRRNR